MFRPLIAIAVAALGFALPALAANPQVEFDTTAGKIRVELYPDAAPKTVANFLDYVKAKHYDGTQFHRVIGGFMIQGGGFTPDFKQKPTRPPIPIESEQSSKAGLTNVPGTLAMARTSDPNSATAQFFINVADNKFLNFREATQQGYGYTVFGKVVPGMDVVDKIATAPTGAGGPFPKDVPAEKVVINNAVVVDAIGVTMVILHTNHGDITLELDAERAGNRREFPPVRARRPLRQYDLSPRDRRLHDPGRRLRQGLKQKPTAPPSRTRRKNGLKNKRYTVAMARTSDPHSATAQFFINVADNDFLDHKGPTRKAGATACSAA